jgi:hypothetical protein
VNPTRRVVHVRIASLRVGAAAAGVALALAGCSATNPATIATPFDPADGRNAQLGGEPGNGGGDGNYQGNGGVKLRNFLLVSQGGDQAGVVVGAISNDTGRAARLALSVVTADSSGQAQELGSTTVNLPPGAFVQLGNPVGASGGATSAGTASATSSGAAGPGVSPSTAVGNEPAQNQVLWFQVTKVPRPAGAVIQLVARDPVLGSVSLDLPILPPVDEYANLTPTPPAPSPSSTGGPTASIGGSTTPQPTANPSGAAHQPTPTPSG